VCPGSRPAPRFLRNLKPEVQYRVLLNNLYHSDRYSLHFRRKVNLLTRQGKLSQIERWFHTADGMITSLLLVNDLTAGIITSAPFIDLVDSITRFCIESCANNYSTFLKELKAYKKALRKHYALGGSSPPPAKRCMATYKRLCEYVLIRDFPTEEIRLQHLMLVTQSRSTGLADKAMIDQSIEKLVETVTLPSRQILLETRSLSRVCAFAGYSSSNLAKLSAGPSGCLEVPREDGGQTTAISAVVKGAYIDSHYCPITGHITRFKPRRIRSAEDLLDWAIQFVLGEQDPRTRTITKLVRVHSVAEPSKARTITIAPIAYMLIMHIFSHIWGQSLRDKAVDNGMHGTNHLWKILKDDLDPTNTFWQGILIRDDLPVYSLNTDLETATDYGNISVARQIWQMLIVKSSAIHGFPCWLALLAKSLFISKRYLVHNGRILCTKSRGWFMGDPMCKVILTLAQNYVLDKSGLTGWIVGDDLTVLSQDKKSLENYPDELESIDFKVSYEDTYVSSRFMYFCEEIARVPQGPSDTINVQRRNGRPVLGYIDYPKIRLLIPTMPEIVRPTYTDLGRFTNLGLHTKWTKQLSRLAYPMMDTAQLLQHLTVKTPKEVICNYLPKEIGGDGSYPTASQLLSALKRSKNPKEATFRIRSLLEGVFSERHIMTTKSRSFTPHRSFAMRDLYSRIEPLFPQDSVVRGQNPFHHELLGSCRLFKEPFSQILRMAHAAYWREILSGKDPPQLVMELNYNFSPNPNTDWVELSMDEAQEFVLRWANPGFAFRDKLPYFIDDRVINAHDYMHLPWSFSARDIGITHDELRHAFVESNYSELVKCENSLMNSLKFGESHLTQFARDRLPYYMESDAFIMWQYTSFKDQDKRSWIPLITADIRLGRLLQQISKRGVIVINPLIYIVGRLYDALECVSKKPFVRPSEEIIEDPGAILHYHQTVMTCLPEGEDPSFDWVDTGPLVADDRGDNLYYVHYEHRMASLPWSEWKTAPHV